MAQGRGPEHPMGEVLRAIFDHCSAKYGEAETRKVWLNIARKAGRPKGKTDAWRDWLLMAGAGYDLNTHRWNPHRGKPNWRAIALDVVRHEAQFDRSLLQAKRFLARVKADEKRARRLWGETRTKREAPQDAPSDQSNIARLLVGLEAVLLEANRERGESYLMAQEKLRQKPP
jgi:hypothetical protein